MPFGSKMALIILKLALANQFHHSIAEYVCRYLHNRLLVQFYHDEHICIKEIEISFIGVGIEGFSVYEFS